MGIPETIPQIRTVDIPEMAHHAAKESNPLYPVPVLMDEGHLAADVSETDARQGGKRMNAPLIEQLVAAQRRFFASGQTLDLAFRKQSLLTLKRAIRVHEEAVNAALM